MTHTTDLRHLLLARGGGNTAKAKQAAQELLHQQNTAAAARDALVQEKRRLEALARALGVSRKTAAELAHAYFTNPQA